jgi:hypothetical protein
MNSSEEKIRSTLNEFMKGGSTFYADAVGLLKKNCLAACHLAANAAQNRWVAGLTPSKIAEVLIIVTQEGWSCDDHETGAPDYVVEAMRVMIVTTLGTDSVYESDVLYVLKHQLSDYCWKAHFDEERNWVERLNRNRVAHALAEVTQPNRAEADLISAMSKF